jgi:DNA helicase-2/ATP-dependent DNA helicase PcrA
VASCAASCTTATIRVSRRSSAASTIIDAALRFARDAVDNLADLDEVAAFAADLREVLDRPSQRGRGPSRPSARGRPLVAPQLAVLARAYDAEKRRRGLIDFSDQVAGALEVVMSHPSVAADLRDRYRVLLDEYQDIRRAERPARDPFADTPVMAVGDPHQSIYGWRGASAGTSALRPRLRPGEPRRRRAAVLAPDQLAQQ